MSSKIANTQTVNQMAACRAKTGPGLAKETTVSVAQSGRVVVTRQQNGELKLRYAPIESHQMTDGQTSAH